MPVQYYPDRSKGRWLAFRTWIVPVPGSVQAVPIEWRIYKGEFSPASHQWPLEIVFRSMTCWAAPFRELWFESTRCLSNLAREPERFYNEHGEFALQNRVSRIDWAIDTDEIAFRPEDAGRFVTRARWKAQFHETKQWTEWNHDDVGVYHVGAEFTGLSFGKGKIVVRIYNKWIEVTKNASYRDSKRFFADLWQQHGWDKSRPVWRAEVQVRREGLRELVTGDGRTFANLTIPETVAAFPSTLPYFFGEWISLRIPTEDSNRYRWPLDPAWQHMIDVASGLHGTSERLSMRRVFDDFSLARTIVGLLSSYGVAIGESSPVGLINQLPTALARSLGMSEADLLAHIKTEIHRKAAKYGIRMTRELMPNATDPAYRTVQ